MSIKDEMYAELKRQWEQRSFIAAVEADLSMISATETEEG